MISEASYGVWSLVPVFVVILLAMATRKILFSLFVGLWVGYLVLATGDPWAATLSMIEGVVATLRTPSNAYTILFTFSIGALMALLQYSGGVAGFLKYISAQLNKLPPRLGKRRLVQALAVGTGSLFFIESNVSILVVGTLFRPLFDHLRLSREKLAYLCDSTAAPVCVLLPFNAWGGYILSVLALNGFEDPLSVLLSAMLFNWYPVLALCILWATIVFGFEIGPMRTAKARAEGQCASSGVGDGLEAHAQVRPRARNMLMPLGFMLLLMPCLMLYTGWSETAAEMELFPRLKTAFLNGKGTFSVLMASLFALGFALLLYRRQRLFSYTKSIEQAEKGAINMRSLAILMLFAFSLGALCRELQTGVYLAELLRGHIHFVWVPTLFFVLSCLIAFSTGTSWGTFAMALSLVLPITEATGADAAFCVAAVLGGGIFGDHCSPISDTTLVSSLAAGCKLMAHVSTQLPYALLAGGLTVLLYIIFAFLNF